MFCKYDKKPKVIMFVVNPAVFFLSHRLPIALQAKKCGYEVHIATPFGSEVQTIKDHGFVHHAIPFTRKGQNLIIELKVIIKLIRLFVHIKPDLLHLVSIKPILYGGIAARISGVKKVVCAVTGLGTVFLGNTLKSKLRRWLVLEMYRAALKQNSLAVIFQNHDDSKILLTAKVVGEYQVHIIRGSGVLLADYPHIPEPKKKYIIVMVSRLLEEKGVLDFEKAARILLKRGLNVEMRLIGSVDSGNPSSIDQNLLDQWALEGNIQLLGYCDDIAIQYANSNIACLPSYREGLPKSLIEAAACGRPVVTTDVPGCRDAIIPEKTGILVPVNNAKAIADAIQILIENPVLRRKMGDAGRSFAEEFFGIDKIVKQHLAIYEQLLEN